MATSHLHHVKLMTFGQILQSTTDSFCDRRDGHDKARAPGIFQHITCSHAKLNTAQLRIIDLNHFLSKQEESAFEDVCS